MLVHLLYPFLHRFLLPLLQEEEEAAKRQQEEAKKLEVHLSELHRKQQQLKEEQERCA